MKRLSALLKGIALNYNRNFYGLKCLHSFSTKNELESNEKVCKNNYFCSIRIPCEENMILKFTEYLKFNKAPYLIYADLESLIKKIWEWKINLEKSSTTKVGKHIQCKHSASTILALNGIENKHDVHRGEDWINRFCKSLRKQVLETITKRKWYRQ